MGSGSLWSTWNARQSWMNARGFRERYILDPVGYEDNDLPADKSSILVFYCPNKTMCRKAPNAARRAKKMGYGDVKVMSAGISGWLAAEAADRSR